MLGPLDAAQTFATFCPGRAASRELHALVRLYTNDEWTWQLRLLLRDVEIPGVRLGGAGELGWTTWLGGRRATVDDVVIQEPTARLPSDDENYEAPMGDISRVALFGKLNSLAYKAIESATVFCKLRGNPYVELVHWIHQILQQQNSDLHLHRARVRARCRPAGAGSHRGARPAAARGDLDLRPVGAHRGCRPSAPGCGRP